MSERIAMSRAWAMPSPQTFSIPPIEALLRRHLTPSMVIVDPFSRGSRWGTVTNDLDPSVEADYHMDAVQFCLEVKSMSVDAVLFDPPYSPRQISEVYKRIGLTVGMTETQNGRLYKSVKDGLSALLSVGGVAICCGWNSSGFGINRGFELIEVMVVAHGGAHNDTIVTVERKLAAPMLHPRLDFSDGEKATNNEAFA